MLKKFFQKDLLEAGVDEAGRGCLAGPVFAAAVILREDRRIPGLNDSKKLSEKDRNDLRKKIEERSLAFSVAQISPGEIDKVNILNASFLAMHNAVKTLNTRPQLLLIDGNRFNPLIGYEFKCIVKGDAKFQSIAAASILAKTYRDEYMTRQHHKFPHYEWISNKGYPTFDHRAGIEKHGVCHLHRKSFQLLNNRQLSIFNKTIN